MFYGRDDLICDFELRIFFPSISDHFEWIFKKNNQLKHL